jgi:hypothetical protein
MKTLEVGKLYRTKEAFKNIPVNSIIIFLNKKDMIRQLQQNSLIVEFELCNVLYDGKLIKRTSLSLIKSPNNPTYITLKQKINLQNLSFSDLFEEVEMIGK